MTNEEYVETRLKFIEEVDELLEGCNGCEAMKQLCGRTQVTERANTCKACPLGSVLATYGDKFMQTTKDFRKSKNI